MAILTSQALGGIAVTKDSHYYRRVKRIQAELKVPWELKKNLDTPSYSDNRLSTPPSENAVTLSTGSYKRE